MSDAPVRTDPEKSDLRRLSEARRAQAAAGSPDAAARLAGFASALLARSDGAVAGYWPLGTEIDPRLLMGALSAAGRPVLLPRAHAPARSGDLTFHRWSPGEPLQTGRFGVSEPGAEAEAMRPGLLLVPLLAFDGRGGRLGYGAGYYDRALRRLRAEGPALAVGLAFAAQEVAAVPVRPWDERLDAVLTEAGLRDLARDPR